MSINPLLERQGGKIFGLSRFEQAEGLKRSARKVFPYRETESKVDFYQLVGRTEAREPISNESLILAQNQRWRRA
jgi:hypothetical protein